MIIDQMLQQSTILAGVLTTQIFVNIFHSQSNVTLCIQGLLTEGGFYHNIPTTTPTSVNRDPIASPAAP